MPDELTQKVLSAIASVKRIPPERVSLEGSLADFGLDSLDTITLLFELEKQFDISISDEQARAIRSVRDMVEGVRKLVEEAARDKTAATG
jgi:acyl carrier protein